MPAASPAPGLNASWNANARTPVSKREKVLLQPDFDISVRASSPAVFRGSRNTKFCSTHGFSKERVGVNRVPRPDEQRWFSYREQRLHHAGGEKDITSHGASFCKPAVHVPEQNRHASFPYAGHRLLCCKVKHVLGPGPSAACWGRGSALEKPMGRDTHQSQGFLATEIFILLV